MKVAILGGGLTGLTCAYELSKSGQYDISLFEEAPALGGLAGGFLPEGWSWSLERVYHHIFSSDEVILSLSQEVGFHGFDFHLPITSSLYSEGKKFARYQLDSPISLLRLPLLSLPERLRVGAVMALFKFFPFSKVYEKRTAISFLRKTMGERGWEVVFSQLFEKKFGRYAEEILASFIWARVSSRTQKLGYPIGGFQNFVDCLAKVAKQRGVKIYTGFRVNQVYRSLNKSFNICTNEQNWHGFDLVVSTIPSPAMLKICRDIFPRSYIKRLSGIKYLWAGNLILETEEPVLNKEYWLSIATSKVPFMVCVQHTNMIDKKNYGGRHILYVGKYFDNSDRWINQEKKEVLEEVMPHLEKISHIKKISLNRSFFFRAPYAQPIFNKSFLHDKPDFETPVDNFFVANLDMTYPYDRGTNYAVDLGRRVVDKIWSKTKID